LQAACQNSSIGSCELDHRFSIPLTLIFIMASYIWRARPYRGHWSLFHSGSFSFRWLMDRTILAWVFQCGDGHPIWITQQ
jgi:hypothetical protein